MTTKTIYTAIFGNHDDLKEPKIVTPGWKYICFTDQELTSDVWDIRKVPLLPEGPRHTARYYKIMFHHHIEDDISIWIDASFQINTDLNKWMQRFRPPMTLMKHSLRSCVYLEAQACIRNVRDNPKDILEHINKYRLQKMPRDGGMAASGMMIRQRTPEVIAFCEMWYKELCDGCLRDQISWAYVQWKMRICKLIDWDYAKHTEFLWIPHFSRGAQREKYIAKYKSMNLI